MMNDCEIYSSRILNAPVALVYKAFENPEHLKNWWGPEGFTNTIHEFDLQPGDHCKFTMHESDQGHYENSSVFKTINPQKLVHSKRISQPWFDMEIEFESLSETQTKISFKMIFETAEACNKIRGFATPKNEENFDRLQVELLKMQK